MIFKGINIIGSFDPSQIAGRLFDVDPARVDTSTGFWLFERAHGYTFGATGTPNPDIMDDPSLGDVFSFTPPGGYVTSLKMNGDGTLPIVKDPSTSITLYVPFKQVSSSIGAAFVNVRTGNDILQSRIALTINFSAGVITPANRPIDGGTSTQTNIATTFNGNWNLLVWKIDLVTDNWRVYLNGTQINTRNTINGGSTVYDDTDSLRTNIGFTACDVQYYRTILYDGAHDDVTRGKIEQWYKRKGITAIA